MKKSLKITLGLIGIFAVLLVIDLVCTFTISRPLFAIKKENVYRGFLFDTYNCEEFSTSQIKPKNAKYSCQESTKDKENKDEHSFFGKIVESHSTYLIVSPNEDEEERNSADKFHINLGNKNDAIYKVGDNVKVTYSGYIKETYPAQIEVTDIELKSTDDFFLIFQSKKEDIKRKIIDKNENSKYNYDVYMYGGTFDIKLGKETYSLEKALKENKITVDEIIAKASKDFPNAKTYKDGGSVEYHYDDYTIIKFHTIEGNRDVYFGNRNLKRNDVK